MNLGTCRTLHPARATRPCMACSAVIPSDYPICRDCLATLPHAQQQAFWREWRGRYDNGATVPYSNTVNQCVEMIMARRAEYLEQAQEPERKVA